MGRLLVYLLSRGLRGRGAALRPETILRLLKTLPPARLAKALGALALILEGVVLMFLAPRLIFLRTPIGLALGIAGMIYGHKLIMRAIAKKLGLSPGPRVAGEAEDPCVINVTARRRHKADKNAQARSEPGARLLGQGPSRARAFWEDHVTSRIRRLDPVTYYAGLAGLYLLLIITLVLIQVFLLD